MKSGKLAGAAVAVLILALVAAAGLWWLAPPPSAPAPEVQVARVEVGAPVADQADAGSGAEAPGPAEEARDLGVAEAPARAAAPDAEKPSEVVLPAEGGGAPQAGGAEGPLASAGDVHAETAQENPEKKEPPPNDYSGLLKNPASLGFHPDERLFRDVYYNIRQSFVEPVTDEQLFAGMVKEVKVLLTQAKVPTDGLARLDKSRNVLRQLVDLYGNKVPKDVLTFAAIQGMLQGLDDPYSLLMPPEEYRHLQEQVQNREFGGIGIYIELDKDNGNQLTVFEPIEGTPAAKAGLEAGDRIVAIDGKTTRNITLDKAQASIRGPVGSRVVLTVTRKGVQGTLDFPITRGNIHVVSVTSRMLPDKIGYIRLRQFGTLTSTELEKELQRLQGQGARALVLDLRNNGGGYIDAAVGVVGQFTSPGSLVVYTMNRQKDRRNYTSSTRGGVPLPVVVLINRFSASASEITAGALRDHKIASLVGEKSFGKGSVQQLYPFSDESALKLTIARFYSPAGNVIDGKGLVPDVKVEMEPRYVGKLDKDTQLKRAMEILKKRVAAAP